MNERWLLTPCGFNYPISQATALPHANCHVRMSGVPRERHAIDGWPTPLSHKEPSFTKGQICPFPFLYHTFLFFHWIDIYVAMKAKLCSVALKRRKHSIRHVFTGREWICFVVELGHIYHPSIMASIQAIFFPHNQMIPYPFTPLRDYRTLVLSTFQYFPNISRRETCNRKIYHN